MSPMLKSLRGSSRHTGLTVSAALLISLGACNPYERRSGEYNAGAVDPIKFPTAYLGAGGKGNRPGMGSFQYVTATANGQAVIYYPLRFNGKQAGSPPSQAQLDLAKLQTPIAYVFDRDGQDPGTDSDKCTKADGYTFDKQQDAVRYDRQGNIFTKLPVDSDPAGKTSYVPIVREVVVKSNGNPCQDIKSEATLVQRPDVTVNLDPPPAGVANALPTGHPTDRYFVFAIIDPAADVQPPDKSMLDKVTGLGPQRWGWYQQYLLAYLDGGELKPDPNQPAMGTKVMMTQKLYWPDQIPVDDPDHPGMKMLTDGALGMGFDVIQHRRGETAYSPVCRVFSFSPKDPMNPEKTEADIMANGDMVTDTKQYVYCIQTP